MRTTVQLIFIHFEQFRKHSWFRLQVCKWRSDTKHKNRTSSITRECASLIFYLWSSTGVCGRYSNKANNMRKMCAQNSLLLKRFRTHSRMRDRYALLTRSGITYQIYTFLFLILCVRFTPCRRVDDDEHTSEVAASLKTKQPANCHEALNKLFGSHRASRIATKQKLFSFAAIYFNSFCSRIFSHSFSVLHVVWFPIRLQQTGKRANECASIQTENRKMWRRQRKHINFCFGYVNSMPWCSIK